MGLDVDQRQLDNHEQLICLVHLCSIIAADCANLEDDYEFLTGVRHDDLSLFVVVNSVTEILFGYISTLIQL